MNTRTNESVRGFVAAVAALLVTSLLLVPAASAQSVAESYHGLGVEPGGYAYTLEYGLPGAHVLWSSEEQQGPPEVRIMNRIIQTALQDVKAPELPTELTGVAEGEKEELETQTEMNVRRAYAIAGDAVDIFRVGGTALLSGEHSVSGFYMSGYGYLFNIRWHVGGTNIVQILEAGGRGSYLFNLQEQNRAMQDALAAAVARRERTDEERRQVEQRAEEAQKAAADVLAQEAEKAKQRRAALEHWEQEYQSLIIEALKDVIANYGGTLTQVQANEAVTFMVEFGSDVEDSVTLTVMGQELRRPGTADAARTKAAIRVSRGGTDVSDALRTQMRIMSEIIDAAFEEQTQTQYYAVLGRAGTWSSGGTRIQYIPGYGVIFRKPASMSSFARNVVIAAEPDRARTEARELYEQMQISVERSAEQLAEHLQMLKEKTAEILTTYGSSMTELKPDEWISIHYDVGGGIQLLQGGPDYFLVQARVSDVREAANRSGEAGVQWLLERLVTNEKPQEG